MDRLKAMQVFVEVAERGSLTDTATVLNMSRAMVSRYLESLEHWLGVRVLHRTTRRVSLTDAGSEALERCRQMLELADDVQSVAGDRRSAPSGSLRITTATSFAEAHMAAAVADFLNLHPQARVELIVLERAVNLVEERIDLAVRISNRIDDTLVARKLAECRSVVCAAPAYLKAHGTPAVPDDLKQHRCITHTYVGRHEFVMRRDGHTVKVPVRGQLSSNEAGVTLNATLAGGGIALLPTYYASEAIRDGRLIPLLTDWEPEVLAIQAVYLSRQHQPQLLRLMLDFLAQRFGGDVAPWDQAIAATTTATTTATATTAKPVKARKVNKTTKANKPT